MCFNYLEVCEKYAVCEFVCVFLDSVRDMLCVSFCVSIISEFMRSTLYASLCVFSLPLNS
jgi:hypothetical protein